jgi:hypothetical protein
MGIMTIFLIVLVVALVFGGIGTRGRWGGR